MDFPPPLPSRTKETPRHKAYEGFGCGAAEAAVGPIVMPPVSKNPQGYAPIPLSKPAAKTPTPAQTAIVSSSEQKIARLKEQLRAAKAYRQLSSSEDSEVEVEPEPWTEIQFQKVREQLLKSHETGRSGHGSAGSDPSGLEFYAELKYNILMEHLDTHYGLGAEKKKGEVPPIPEQVDRLITLIVQDCKSCSRLRKTRLQEQASDQKERERRKADWEFRYTARLECDEYESGDDHVAETKCGKCSLPAGRRAKVGRTYGDKRDQDDLYNCEGADCFKAFHRDCRPGLEKDTPESRRAHGLPADQPLQFGRRFEPWLCPDCWSTAGRKQIAHERFQHEREKHKLNELVERLKRARLPQSEDEQSDPSGDKPETSTLSPKDHVPVPEPTGLYPRYPVNSSLDSLSALNLSMSDGDAASLALPAAVPAPSLLALLRRAMGTGGVQQHEG